MMNSSLQRVMMGEPQGVMNSPFAPIGPQQPPQAQAPQPTLSQQDSELQVLDSLRQKYGPDFMQKPEVQELLKLLKGKSENELMGASAKADRTLAAMLGR